MAVIAMMMTISASAQFYIYCSDGNVIKVDSISMVAPGEPEQPNPSAGIGVFSVGEGKTVTFSKGNLQYTQSTNTWSFAETQWEMIGTDNVTGGSVSSDPTFGESKEGTALADKIDLFCWSTSATNFGVSTSTDDNDYSGSFVDWGTNKIGNDEPNKWRTLSYDEWYYLRYTRTNADALCGVAQVNGVNGLIFLPDTWVCPEGITFKSGFHSSYGVDYYAAYQTFTADQWSTLESAGAVFLPASSRRYGSNVGSVQYDGYYWSAAEYNSDNAYGLSFTSGEAGVYGSGRIFGQSVRLVKDTEGEITTPDKPTEPDTPTEPEEPKNTENGHEYVDLGLSVKWATCNVGATKPEEYGDYFAWGEVEPKEEYNWSTYKWCNGSDDTQTKYCTNSYYGTVDNKNVLESVDDAASVNWGGAWRMPTEVELIELRDNCTWTWTTQNGMKGYTVTGSNGNSIFLPAAGTRIDSSLNNTNSYGYYWSSSLRADYPYDAYDLRFHSSTVYWDYSCRGFGQSVRPVCE